MAVQTEAPSRPLTGSRTIGWPRSTGWYRVYHDDKFTTSATDFRLYGPISRFDPHTPDTGDAKDCPEDRKVLYAAENLGTAIVESFALGVDGNPTHEIGLCDRWTVAKILPKGVRPLLDMASHWMMSLGTYATVVGAERDITHLWAKAAYVDPLGRFPASGIYYRSAYDFGNCLAFWDKGCGIEVVGRPDGTPFDFPLKHLPSDVAELFAQDITERGVIANVIPNDQCPLCCDPARVPGGP